MKVQYVILLVAVIFEASISIWPGVFVEASEAQSGKPKRVRKRTYRVREIKPPLDPSPVAPAPAPAIQPATVAKPAVPIYSPISNEVHVKPEISVHMSPQQEQHHHQEPQQVVAHPPAQAAQPVVHVVQAGGPSQPAPAVQPIVAQKPQQQPPNDEDDDEEDEDEEIVHRPPEEHKIVPVTSQEPQMQFVSPRHFSRQVIEKAGEQINLLPQHHQRLFMSNPGRVVLVNGGDDKLRGYNNNNNILDANTTRYIPPGLDPYANLVAANQYGVPLQARNQQGVPMIQVNIDEQFRQPWPITQVPVPYAMTPLGPSVASYGAATSVVAPLWQQQQQPISYYTAAPPVGASLYQQAASFYPSFPASGSLVAGLDLVPQRVSGGYYGGGVYPAGAPMVQQSPRIMMAPAMMQPAPIMVQQPVMMQAPFLPQPVIIEKTKKNKKSKKNKVVVEETKEPEVEMEAKWIRKEPEFNQFIQEKAPTSTKVVEVQQKVEEKPQEVQWQRVLVPKIK